MSRRLSGTFRPVDSVTGRLILVGCSAEKSLAPGPLPALDLYDGGVVPPLRAWLTGRPQLQDRLRFLSAEHGLVRGDTLLRTYDRPLDPGRAAELRPAVMRAVRRELATDGVPHDVLVVAEPLYLTLIADLLALHARPRVHWIPDHAHGWPQALAVLTRWGW